MKDNLSDIDVKRLPRNIFMSPRLGNLLQNEAEEIAALYQAKVAKRTGRLAESANPYVTVGGHKRDRLIGKVVVGNALEYAALHEFGSKTNPEREAAKDLAEVMQAKTSA